MTNLSKFVPVPLWGNEGASPRSNERLVVPVEVRDDETDSTTRKLQGCHSYLAFQLTRNFLFCLYFTDQKTGKFTPRQINFHMTKGNKYDTIGNKYVTFFEKSLKYAIARGLRACLTRKDF